MKKNGKNGLNGLVVAVWLAGSSLSALATEPATDDISKAVRTENARTHYVKAEIMVGENDWPGARWELEIAKQLQPDFSFVSASAVSGLQAKIENGENKEQEKQNKLDIFFLGVIPLSLIVFTFLALWAIWRRPNKPSDET